MKHTFHISATKAWIMSQIEQYGTEVLDNFDGTTEEALAEVAADPRTHFPVGDCDNQSPEGKCLGHFREDEQPQPRGD